MTASEGSAQFVADPGQQLSSRLGRLQGRGVGRTRSVLRWVSSTAVSPQLLGHLADFVCCGRHRQKRLGHTQAPGVDAHFSDAPHN